MERLGSPVRKVDHYAKVSGEAKYVGDYRMEHMLYGIMVRSTVPHARIKSIHYPEMEEGYYTVDAHDMTEPNFLRDEKDGQQIYADDGTVEEDLNYAKNRWN